MSTDLLGSETLLAKAERRVQVLLDEVQRLSNELAEARGEIAALELGNGDLQDELEQMAQREKEEDHDLSDAW